MSTLEAALARRRALESGAIWAACIENEYSPGIWLGAGRDAKNLDELRKRRVTRILNCADDVENFHSGEADLSYLNLGLADFGADAGASRVFPEAIAFVQAAIDDGARLLIHCANGSNRSATVSIAVLLGAFGMSLAQAWATVHSRRPEAKPLADNRRELLAFEAARSPAGRLPTMVEGAGGTLVPTAVMMAAEAEADPACPSAQAQPAPVGSVRAVGRRVRFQAHTGDGDIGGLVWTVSTDGSVQVKQDIPAGCTPKLFGVSNPDHALEVLHGSRLQRDQDAVAEAAMG